MPHPALTCRSTGMTTAGQTCLSTRWAAMAPLEEAKVTWHQSITG